MVGNVNHTQINRPYATALWMMGRAGALGELAVPESDRHSLEAEVRAALLSRGTRAPKRRAI